jgi:hypothetical protein
MTNYRQSGGGQVIRVVAICAFIAILVAYALQTMSLVSWLFPQDDLFMKCVTVFICDGCCCGYGMGEMFYRFRLRSSKNWCYTMWVVTFILSTAATVIQMYLSSTHTIPHTIDSQVIVWAYGLVIAGFIVNIIAITCIIRAEHNAGLPAIVYLDDTPGELAAPVTVHQLATATAPGHQAKALPAKKKLAAKVGGNTTTKP